jgi:hypothetical protein
LARAPRYQAAYPPQELDSPSCSISAPASLRASLGFLSLEPREPELRLLHCCFDTWRGIGDVVAGMARQEYDLELRRYDGRGWRAMFFLSGFEHSLTADAGSAWAPSPWEAVPRAAAATTQARLADVRTLQQIGEEPGKLWDSVVH